MVFSLVTERLPEWFAMVHRVQWEHSQSKSGHGQLGECSERTCDFGGKTLIERITRFERDRHYSYEADMQRSTVAMPIRRHRGTFDLEPTDGGTRVRWRQYFDGAAWWAPVPMLRWKMRSSMMVPAVDGLIERYRGRWISKR